MSSGPWKCRLCQNGGRPSPLCRELCSECEMWDWETQFGSQISPNVDTPPVEHQNDVHRKKTKVKSKSRRGKSRRTNRL